MKSRLGSTILCSLALLGTLAVAPAAFAQAPAAPTGQPAPATPPAAQPAPSAQPAPWGSSAAPASPPPAGQPAPAPGYAPPPGYKLVPVQEQPPAQYPPQYPPQQQQQQRPPEMPYTEGQKIPPGYRVVERSRRGLIIAGLVTTGVAWSFSVTAAVTADYEDNSGFLLLPVLGPWLMLATGGADDPPCVDDGDSIEFCESNAGLRGILVLDGLVQTAGGVMFVLGVANPVKRLVRDDVSFRVVPMKVGKTGNGLGVVGTF